MVADEGAKGQDGQDGARPEEGARQAGPYGFVLVPRPVAAPRALVRTRSEAEHKARGREILATAQNAAEARDLEAERADNARRWTMWLRLVVQALALTEGRFAQVSVPAGEVCARVCAVLTRVRAGEPRGRFAVRVGASLTSEYVSLTVWGIHPD